MPTLFQPSMVETYLAIQSLLLLLLLLLSATATPITNITTPILTLPTNDIGIQCSKAQTWVADGFDRSDCLGIIDYIWKNEALERKSQDYEFTSLGATAKTDLPKIVTPIKFEYLTCVVTIAMLDRFQPRELPGSDFRKRYEETDVAKFEDVWSAAVTVDFNCGRFGKAGWVVMGK